MSPGRTGERRGYAWLNLAAAGDELAAKGRDELEKFPTPAQVAEGQALGRELEGAGPGAVVAGLPPRAPMKGTLHLRRRVRTARLAAIRSGRETAADVRAEPEPAPRPERATPVPPHPRG